MVIAHRVLHPSTVCGGPTAASRLCTSENNLPPNPQPQVRYRRCQCPYVPWLSSYRTRLVL
uniref:Uncharacterized protein n=1 Tax=Anguilla anguilla TaxID=7936 RepID=A0A0E9V9R4_ANGAN